jgi:hypothetical protein
MNVVMKMLILQRGQIVEHYFNVPPTPVLFMGGMIVIHMPFVRELILPWRNRITFVNALMD